MILLVYNAKYFNVTKDFYFVENWQEVKRTKNHQVLAFIS